MIIQKDKNAYLILLKILFSIYNVKVLEKKTESYMHVFVQIIKGETILELSYLKMHHIFPI